MVTIHPLSQIPEIRADEALIATLRDALAATALLPLRGGDVLVITQKILYKSEGRTVDLATVKPGVDAIKLSEKTKKIRGSANWCCEEAARWCAPCPMC